ncbi:hypothetical protein PG990_008162 [Apiospora arundinis]
MVPGIRWSQWLFAIIGSVDLTSHRECNGGTQRSGATGLSSNSSVKGVKRRVAAVDEAGGLIADVGSGLNGIVNALFGGGTTSTSTSTASKKATTTTTVLATSKATVTSEKTVTVPEPSPPVMTVPPAPAPPPPPTACYGDPGTSRNGATCHTAAQF